MTAAEFRSHMLTQAQEYVGLGELVRFRHHRTALWLSLGSIIYATAGAELSGAPAVVAWVAATVMIALAIISLLRGNYCYAQFLVLRQECLDEMHAALKRS